MEGSLASSAIHWGSTGLTMQLEHSTDATSKVDVAKEFLVPHLGKEVWKDFVRCVMRCDSESDVWDVLFDDEDVV